MLALLSSSTQVNLDHCSDKDWPFEASLYIDGLDAIIKEPDKQDP